MAISFRNIKSSKEDIFFIGIDQSMVHTGITVLNEQGIAILSQGFSTSNNIYFEERLLSIRKFLFDIIEMFPYDRTAIAIEGLAYDRKNTNNGVMLFGLFSVILSELLNSEFKYSIIAPTSLKKLSTGYGFSSKIDMINSIDSNEKLNLERLSGIRDIKKFEDISDSYWLARAKFHEK